MTKRIIYTNQDGGVAVVVPSPTFILVIPQIARDNVIVILTLMSENAPKDVADEFNSRWPDVQAVADDFVNFEAFFVQHNIDIDMQTLRYNADIAVGNTDPMDWVRRKDVPDDFEVFDVPTGVFETDPDTGEQFEVMSGRIHEHAAEIVETSTIPSERMFRNAWEKSGNTVATDIPKAKLLAHDMRRTARDEEMVPLDIKSTIPNEATKAEADRVLVRAKYDTAQINIDNAVTEDDLIQIVSNMV